MKQAAEQRKLEALDAEVDSRKSEETWTNIESVFDALTKRRIRRPVSTAQRAKRLSEQSQLDLEATQAKLAELNQQLAELEARLAAEQQAVTDKWSQAAQVTQPLQLTPKKSDIRAELFGVGWIPSWQVRVGEELIQLPAFASGA
jgi:hypothetical protein